MPTRQDLELGKIRPLLLFAVILALLFVSEVLVMLVLARLSLDHQNSLVVALIDASLLSLVLAPLLWFLIIRPLQRLAAARQQLLALALSVQEHERGRISRDLHDSLGQALTSLTIGLRTIEESSSDENIKCYAQELRRVGSDTHEEVRRLARGLRPAVLDDLGLAPALDRYVDDLRSTHHLQATFEHDCQDRRFADDIQTAVYRIVQEAATNAIRHGQAKSLKVKLSCDTRNVTIEISDDGIGFDVAAALRSDPTKSPFGLLSIHERAGFLGGKATITSQPKQGTKVQVTIPLPHSQDQHG
jgi:signal transduction histidine kinase